jgi:hypothetical protein
VITTAYQDAVGGALKHDSIEMAAGKVKKKKTVYRIA